MNVTDAAHVALNVGQSVTLTALVTLATAFVIGLTLLPHPSRATIVWSSAFGVSMLSVYCFMAAVQLDVPALGALSSALMMSFVPLIWLGLRLHLRRPAPWGRTLSFAVVVPLLLPVLTLTPYYSPLFRAIFVITGVFAAMIAHDLMKYHLGPRDIALPLMLSSLIFVVLAGLTVFDAIVPISLHGGQQLSTVRDGNNVLTLIMTQCSAITIVLLVRLRTRPTARDDSMSHTRGQQRMRLERAERLRDMAWSLLEIRLDNQTDLRVVLRHQAYARNVDAFFDAVLSSLPASADVQQVGDARIRVLLSGNDQFVQHHLRNLLTRVSAYNEAEESQATRVSASVGWASVADHGFDYDTLKSAAAQGVERARALGGDRWERVREAAATLKK